MMLKRRAEELISLAEKTKTDFAKNRRQLDGVISIGEGEFISGSDLACCIAKFCKNHPLVKYQVVSGNAVSICDSIDNGILDIGLVSDPIDVDKYRYITMPSEEIWGVYIPKDLPMAKKSFVTPKDLSEIPILTAINSFPQSIIGKWFGKYSKTANVITMGNLMYNQIILAQQGMGVVMGIKLKTRYDDMVFVPLSPAMHHGTALIWKKDRMLPAARSAFVRFAKEYFQSITDDNI